MVPSGRIFLRRLTDKSMDVELLHLDITLNSETRADLRWWLDFLSSWKGSYVLIEPNWTHFDLSTDASFIGYGAHWQGRYFFGSWSHKALEKPITWKELCAVVLAAAT